MNAAIDPRSRELLVEAAEWRLLSLLFDAPEGAWREQVTALSEEVQDPRLRACARLALEQAGAGLYHSTMGPGGPAASREVAYSSAVEFGYLMSELRAYYDAFAYRPLTGEAPDHVAVEVGFIAFLRMKEAFALASGDSEHASLTAEAAGRFCCEHLSLMGEPLAARLAGSGVSYLAEAAKALLKLAGPGPRNRTSPSGTLAVLREESTFSCGDSELGE